MITTAAIAIIAALAAGWGAAVLVRDDHTGGL